jgi:hypothetical protein
MKEEVADIRALSYSHMVQWVQAAVLTSITQFIGECDVGV